MGLLILRVQVDALLKIITSNIHQRERFGQSVASTLYLIIRFTLSVLPKASILMCINIKSHLVLMARILQADKHNFRLKTS